MSNTLFYSQRYFETYLLKHIKLSYCGVFQKLHFLIWKQQNFIIYKVTHYLRAVSIFLDKKAALLKSEEKEKKNRAKVDHGTYIIW